MVSLALHSRTIRGGSGGAGVPTGYWGIFADHLWGDGNFWGERFGNVGEVY